jgi:phosphatidylglycerophosphatase C
MNLALFDFDGTITVSDTFSSFVRFAVRPTRMLAGRVLLSPLVLGYRLHVVSACQARPVVARFGFKGEKTACLRELGLKYSTEVLPATLRRRALERIEWHKAQGDDVVVVSASLDVYVRPWCESVGVQCICTTFEERNGRVTGRSVHGDCSGPEKVRRILETYELGRYSVIYAYGDTSEDREMLEIAHRKYYRWKEIADWRETTVHSHPGAERAARDKRAG